jgi:rubrerythrin
MLRKIFTLCRSIELAAESAYRRISNQTEVNEHKSFWLDISRDEKRHSTYWELLLELQRKETLTNPFDNPELIVDELNTMKGKIDEIINMEHSNFDFSEFILWAFRIEQYMLHPAFTILFHILEKDTEDIFPEEDYQNHINKFVQAAKKHLKDKPELVLVGDILSNMWERNRELAKQFYQIKILRSLIPICANCKQVRNDQGYWEQIEAYLERYSETTFTHGICPECAKKLYPEITGGNL